MGATPEFSRVAQAYRKLMTKKEEVEYNMKDTRLLAYELMEKLLFKDLRTDTPYNTYTRKGLTPTPIAMPGLGALQAVMHPADTDYLYFVATGDGSGRHYFSSTLEEHEKAVDKYQRKRNK